jgi:hypothetical protein
MNSYSTCVTQIKKKRADTEEFLISPYLTLNTKPGLSLNLSLSDTKYKARFKAK